LLLQIENHLENCSGEFILIIHQIAGFFEENKGRKNEGAMHHALLPGR
jgi:hypothetical protein